MIINYNNNASLKSTLEEFVTISVNLHNDISEKDLFKVLVHEIESNKIDSIDIQPEVNIYKGRSNFGWKHSTLRYLANSDEFSLFLPAAEPLSTPSGVKDIQKFDEEPPIDRTELLRELKQLDIQLSKLIKKVEGGQL